MTTHMLDKVLLCFLVLFFLFWQKVCGFTRYVNLYSNFLPPSSLFFLMPHIPNPSAAPLALPLLLPPELQQLGRCTH